MKDVAIVIPVYRENLDVDEYIAINQAIKVFEGKYDIYFLLPQKMKDWKSNEFCSIKRHIVSDLSMSSRFSYNEIMLSKWFYDYYADYRYMLLYQTDAFVFCDKLKYFCEFDYDYIGAPWIYGMKYYDTGSVFSDEQKNVYVGNGGLSLRKIDSFRKVLTEKPLSVMDPEDVVWAACESETFKVAPIWLASEFAIESCSEICLKMNNGLLPMGVHQWAKQNYVLWSKHIEKMGFDVSGIIGEQKEKKYTKKSARMKYLDKNIYRRVLGKITEKDSPVVWGAGAYGKECAWILKHSGYDVKCFIDNNTEIQGRTIWGIKVCSSEFIQGDDCVVIAAKESLSEEIEQQLIELGVEKENIGRYHLIRDELMECC